METLQVSLRMCRLAKKAEKKTIKVLLESLESLVEEVDTIDSSLEDTLSKYEKTIAISKELLQLLDKQKDTYTVLKQQHDALLNS